MFTLYSLQDGTATFHFDSPEPADTPRRWHTLELPTGRVGFCTDMCTNGNRQPGIPVRLRDKSFANVDEAVDAVLALNGKRE